MQWYDIAGEFARENVQLAVRLWRAIQFFAEHWSVSRVIMASEFDFTQEAELKGALRKDFFWG